jgi:hypothetical protein
MGTKYSSPAKVHAANKTKPKQQSVSEPMNGYGKSSKRIAPIELPGFMNILEKAVDNVVRTKAAVVEDCKEEAMIKTETDDDMGKISGNVSPYPLSREESKAMKYDVKFLPDWIVPADRRDQLLVLEVPFKLPTTPSVMATPIPPPPRTFRPAPIVEHVETRAAGSWMCNDCTFTNGNMCAFCRACGATLVLEFYPCEI